jgi:hypothetical protein
MTTDVVAAAADLAVYVQDDRGAFLLGELAAELVADSSPRAPPAGAGHAEPHQVAHVSQAVIPDCDTTCADAGSLTRAADESRERIE